MAALRFATRKMCGRAFERTPAFFTTAVKEEQRRVLPRFSHGGGSLRRFTSRSGPPSEPPKEPLPHDSTELIRNLHPDTLVRVPVSLDTWSLNNPWFLSNVCKLAVVTTALCAAAVYLEIKYIYVNPKRERNQDQKSKKDD
ncbi:hypothetical protein VPH35_063407 [Triticum aestivum]